MSYHRINSHKIGVFPRNKRQSRQLVNKTTSTWLRSVALLVILSILLSACSALESIVDQVNPVSNNQPATSSETEQSKPVEDQSLETVPVSEAPPVPEALVEFRIRVPENTPVEDSIYLTLLDEVTGLYLNARQFRMVEDDIDPLVYKQTLPFPVGSVIQYRYERQGDELRVAEHVSDGSPVRYRLYKINGPASIEDVVSRWTDTVYESPSGRIMGTATDANTGEPIPNLLIAVGGAQTFTTADGSFLIEGLPPGVHNLVGYAMDGTYQTFQQGAEIAADSTTPTPINLNPATMVDVTFEVKPPEGTPPLVPLRLAGNLLQLGNTFGTLSGGMSTIANRMPVLRDLGNGNLAITLKLPSGADIHYKYTLGDGYWNAEHTPDGEFRLRQLIVPEQDTYIQDTIDTWATNPTKFVTFDITVPENTPVSDYVSIQFNPLFGWTVPIPMWPLGSNRWIYVLYSPLDIPGNLGYRYCRNDQCGYADDVATPGVNGPGRLVNRETLPEQIKEQVTAWVGMDQLIDPASLPPASPTPREDNFISAIELISAYHPSWQPLLPSAMQRIKDLGANSLVIPPTWTATRSNPPVIEQVAGSNALWNDLVQQFQSAHSLGLKIAVKPTISYPQPVCQTDTCPSGADAWWQLGTRDFSWWLVWFDHYRDYLLHHADLAARTGVEMLIIGGDNLNPALPGGVLADGSPSGVPSDADQRWRDIIAEVRKHYTGPLLWALPYKDGQVVPSFLDAVDQVYVEWELSYPTDEALAADLDSLVATRLDDEIQQISTSTSKPIILALITPSLPDLQAQQDLYQAVLNAVNQRSWINGFVSSGYYPPAQLQDQTPSVHGKPAEALLQTWFPGFYSQQ
jgi:hypothetical protein